MQEGESNTPFERFGNFRIARQEDDLIERQDTEAMMREIKG
jgi:hypothetical protein